MTFFKSLLLAIMATILMTYILGISVIDWFNIDIYIDQDKIEPIQAISMSALAAVVMVLVALAIILSIFGALIFTVMALVATFVVFGLSVFWPVLIVALLIYACTRDKPQSQYN
ncbi:hypothetical protein [Thalassotalea crassostreae]|uniref:hypothetical protein n=1 Tax=Thalassotalea crassostreae TaxID=1763536 RepID=UPI000839424F|nr:hypothetical protein [Thalassotalea crassostreae]